MPHRTKGGCAVTPGQMSPWLRLFGVMLLCAMCAAGGAAERKLTIVHPRPDFEHDKRMEYDWAVLRAVLEKTRPAFGDFEMIEVGERMNGPRLVSEVMRPAGRVNIITRTTTLELERTLRPIRIPFDRGILGYRVLLVRRASLPAFAAMHGIADLRPLTLGQGLAWPDTKVLERAGLTVHEAGSYEKLFPMLLAGRFDGVPLGIDEAMESYEQLRAANPELAVEPHLLLYYPLPSYFFVRRDAEGERLARRIQAGLEMMVKDNSLNQLFQKYKGAQIGRAQLNGRLIVRMDNPILPPDTPLRRAELWFDPVAKK